MPKFGLAFALQRCTGEIYPEDLNCLPDDLKKVPTLPNVGIYLSLACEIENGAEQRSQEVVKFLWSSLGFELSSGVLIWQAEFVAFKHIEVRVQER